MASQPLSNESPRTNILAIERGPGWVIFCPREPERLPADFPFGLSQVLEKWLLERPEVRVRATLPIIQHGQTVGFHLWYERGS